MERQYYRYRQSGGKLWISPLLSSTALFGLGHGAKGLGEGLVNTARRLPETLSVARTNLMNRGTGARQLYPWQRMSEGEVLHLSPMSENVMAQGLQLLPQSGNKLLSHSGMDLSGDFLNAYQGVIGEVVPYAALMDESQIERVINSVSADEILGGDFINDFLFEQIYGTSKSGFRDNVIRENEKIIEQFRERGISDDRINSMIDGW